MPPQSGSAAPAPQLRFLVVDDYEDIRDVFSRFVERAGHLARTANDGQHAVEILQQESFDVMLLDLTMPRLDGAGVVRWLSAHPGVAPSMRIVMVTAWAVENDDLLKDLGVGTVLRKPVRLKDLDLLIEQAVRDRLAEDCPMSR
ncbi:response regulator [Nocardioides lacusdianchii]|uniref:response regulator n=1 Tax=Nocardioides lacusdianchii TaxID=2783664 RepID=UPI001CC92C4C|nr:response regulator [Nocardioides lacusdianchii]